MEEKEVFRFAPCVFVVEREYQIVFPTWEYGIAWVEVGGEAYPDAVNGLYRSETTVHRAVVPMAALDRAGEYTVCFRALPERPPYFPKPGELVSRRYAFRAPGDLKDMRIYHIGDAHSLVDGPAQSGAYFGDKLDLLILDGDIPTASKTKDDILSLFEIAQRVTGGERAVLYARGNHDARGQYAPILTEYVGHAQGNTYFTFRLGGLWGVVLDAGEDKLDSDPAYNGTTCFEAFRRRQTEFLRRLIARRQDEYEAEGVERRIAICHIGFSTSFPHDLGDPFDIEGELFEEWTQLLNEMGLDLMLSAHEHFTAVVMPDSEKNRHHANFPVVIGSKRVPPSEVRADGIQQAGAAIVLAEDGFRVAFTNNQMQIEGEAEIPFRKG